MKRSYAFLSVVAVCLACSTTPPSPTLPPATAANAAAFAGPWSGDIGPPGRPIGVELKLVVAGDALGGTLDVASQRLRGRPVSGARSDGKRLAFDVAVTDHLTVHFDGQVEGDRYTGTYTQWPVTVPFTLARGAAAKKVYAQSTAEYAERDVTVRNGAVSLAGTFTLPSGVSRPPVAVLVTGSGPHDRNEEVTGFKVFEELAHALARGGVATLRLDDRGVGESTGDFSSATTGDFASDAAAAVRFLRTVPEVDARRVGLIGHSEGGMVAAADPEVAFVVMLAGPGRQMDELLIAQSELINRAEGQPEQKVQQALAVLRHALALVKSGKDLSSMENELETCDGCSPDTAKAVRARMENAWFRALISYDPQSALRKVRCPVLAMNGSLDLQVPSRLNLPPIRAALAGTSATVEELEGLNHLFQRAKTGAVSEYAKLPRQVDPQVPEKILSFVRGLPAEKVAAGTR